MSEFTLNCPLPLTYSQIMLAHGGGGKLTQQLLKKLIQPIFNNPYLNQNTDSAIVEINSQKIAFTSDSFVIRPLFFRGGDIGKLAVCGTVNDLAMSGAKPLFLSCSLIIEEGFEINQLEKILQSMQATANEANISIITGDTKVVEHGFAEGLYINTAGIGILPESLIINPYQIQMGDAIIVSNDLARHGMSIMLQREGLAFEHTFNSDCTILSPLIQDLINCGIEIHCLRDLTRGGLATALIELAQTANIQLEINQNSLPILPAVASACELLGFDPLYVANEGCFVLFLPASQVERALNCLHQHFSAQAAIQIGNVIAKQASGLVSLKTVFGSYRYLDLLSGEQLPRIC